MGLLASLPLLTLVALLALIFCSRPIRSATFALISCFSVTLLTLRAVALGDVCTSPDDDCSLQTKDRTCVTATLPASLHDV